MEKKWQHITNILTSHMKNKIGSSSPSEVVTCYMASIIQKKVEEFKRSFIFDKAANSKCIGFVCIVQKILVSLMLLAGIANFALSYVHI